MMWCRREEGSGAVDWREGVNPDAYYFIDVVAARGPAPRQR
ncbi:MAG: hypothetical protein ACI4RA_02590 [Kiritimatiellia bacterium]